MNGLTGQTLGGTAAIGLFNLTVNDPLGVTQTTTVTVAGTLDPQRAAGLQPGRASDRQRRSPAPRPT